VVVLEACVVVVVEDVDVVVVVVVVEPTWHPTTSAPAAISPATFATNLCVVLVLPKPFVTSNSYQSRARADVHPR
jgi:hypothetical protein